MYCVVFVSIVLSFLVSRYLCLGIILFVCVCRFRCVFVSFYLCICIVLCLCMHRVIVARIVLSLLISCYHCVCIALSLLATVMFVCIVLSLCIYFKHILLFYTKQLDWTQVSQLRNVFSNKYMNKYKMNLYNIICVFHIK
jgi:hypothetical protein